jgi:hypothetical protein
MHVATADITKAWNERQQHQTELLSHLDVPTTSVLKEISETPEPNDGFGSRGVYRTTRFIIEYEEFIPKPGKLW